MILVADSADPSQSNVGLQIFLIIVLTLLNAFFAASELAVLSSNKTRMQIMADNGNKKAKKVLSLTNNETKFLSTIQVGITFANFFSSATAATSLSQSIVNLGTKLGISISNSVSMVIITIIISYVTLVLGELFPKRVARRFSDKVALFVAPYIKAMTYLTAPFVKLLSISSNFLVKITRVEKNIIDEKISEEEIKSIIKTGESDGIITGDTAKYIDNVFDFRDIEAQEIMTPRMNSFIIDVNTPILEIFKELKQEKYTRVPVYENDMDNIIGILNVKDLLFKLDNYKLSEIKIRKIIRKPLFVKPNEKIEKLMKRFLSSNNQMAIVIDEFGGFSGLLTLEDIMEELVGSINDEYDDSDEIKEVSLNTYVVDGSLSILDINRKLNLTFEKNEDDYNTIAGLIINLLGYIPSIDERPIIEYQNTILKVKEMNANRILKVSIEIIPENAVYTEKKD